MSAAFDALCDEIREANSRHLAASIEIFVKGVENVYRGMLKKGYPDRTAVQSARDFYVEQVKLGWAKQVWNGQHR